jgi:hypothetical protein
MPDPRVHVKGTGKATSDDLADVALFAKEELDEIDEIATLLTTTPEQYIDLASLSTAQRYFLATLRMFGAVSVSPQGKKTRFERSGKIASQFPRILAYYLRCRYAILDEWSRLTPN